MVLESLNPVRRLLEVIVLMLVPLLGTSMSFARPLEEPNTNQYQSHMRTALEEAAELAREIVLQAPNTYDVYWRQQETLASTSRAGSGKGKGKGSTRPVLSNGDFEMANELDEDGAPLRPAHWYVGFPGAAPPPSAGAWTIDDQIVAEGEKSLKVEPNGNGNFLMAQVLHLPSALVAGRDVTIDLQLQHEGMTAPPIFLVIAVNPETGGNAGQLVGMADADEGVWKSYSGTLTPFAPALSVVVVLAATGSTGTAWFDDVRITADPWMPGPGPRPGSVASPVKKDVDFITGFRMALPMDQSDRGKEESLREAAEAGNAVNLAFSVCWCELAGTDFADDFLHREKLAEADKAREHGLEVGLTLDFTNSSPAGVGNLNPMRNGQPPGNGTLLDPTVRQAYLSELLWLYERIQPRYVVVGIEIDVMYLLHPDWWDSYKAMLAQAYDSIKALNVDTHVTTYHRFVWSVDPQGFLREANAEIWRELLPNIDSIAFSLYPLLDLPGLGPDDIPEDIFSVPQEIAAELPLFIAEMGIVGDPSTADGESDQAALLRRVISDLDKVETEAVFWWGLHDTLLLGFPQPFQDAFNFVGMFKLDGTPKESYVLWKKIKAQKLP